MQMLPVLPIKWHRRKKRRERIRERHVEKKRCLKKSQGIKKLFKVAGGKCQPFIYIV